MSDSRVHRCLEPGQSVLVGTVDTHGTPSCCRGVALASSDGLETVTVYVPVATSQQTIHNVALTKRIAVSVSQPISHRATQLKGVALATRLARDDEASLVRAQLDAYADELETIGVPRRVTHSIAHWPAFAVTMRVEQMFDQTPGPNAGSRIQ